ncbi:putative glycogen debranching enzyme, partial [Apostichopus japonicus]
MSSIAFSGRHSDVIAGKYQDMGITKIIDREDQLEGLRDVISNMILPKYKLEQFYQVDNEATVDRFRQLVR